jgi:arsenite oxidase small subunit
MRPREGKVGSDEDARRTLRIAQMVIGATFLLAAASGIFLLVTDGSLWKLAASHAYGLVVMCVVSVVMGIGSLVGVRRIFNLSLLWAIGVIILQLGDIVTAPSYNMTIPYFAAYLFGLPAFDVLLACQALVMIVFLRTVKPKPQLKKGAYFETGGGKGRRDFMRIAGSIGFFLVLTVVLAVADLMGSKPTSSASNVIANLNKLTVGAPLTFNYPDSNHPNILLKKQDGSVVAYSLLCTHVCCQLSYDPGSNAYFCPCHGSTFDGTGQVTRGPAGFPLPTVLLQVNASGDIVPTGVSGTSPCS